jgi:hypothetical protein
VSVAAAVLAALGLVPLPPGALTVDAYFDDWVEVPLVPLDKVVRGGLAGPDDLDARVQLSVMGDELAFAFQVRDDLFQRGTLTTGDGLEILYRGPGGKSARVHVVLNQLEGHPAEVRSGGRSIKGARVASTLRKDGWAVEVSLPLAVFPGFRDAPVGLAVVVRDSDHDPTEAEAVLTTAPLGPDGLPAVENVRFEPALGVYGLYQSERGGTSAELATTRGDIAGDALAEEIVVNEEDVVVAGRGLPDGATYYYFTHGWGPGATVSRLDLMDLDGRPGKEILLERVEHPSGVDVTVVEIYGVTRGVLNRMFAQKLSESFPDRGAEVRSRFKILPAPGRKGPARFEVTRAEARGLDEFTYPPEPAGARSYQPLPLPWQGTGSVFYGLTDDFWTRR